MDPILIKALLKSLILPPGGPLLLSLAGLSIYKHFPRAGRVLVWIGVLSLTALCLPVVSNWLVLGLAVEPPLDLKHAATAQAIVILGGGTRRDAPEYGGDTLNPLTLERVRYGAKVARLTHLPVLVTGGSVFGGKAEGKLMKACLEEEFGVPVRWVEDRSRNTHENAQRSAEILHAEAIHRVLLVGHSFDMPRATAEFAAAGIETIPAPTGIPSPEQPSPFDYLPHVSALQTSYYALHEIIGNLVRRIDLAVD